MGLVLQHLSYLRRIVWKKNIKKSMPPIGMLLVHTSLNSLNWFRVFETDLGSSFFKNKITWPLQ